MNQGNLLKYLFHWAQARFGVPAAQLIGLKQRAYGTDMSRYQAEFKPEVAVSGLFDFGIIKATEGSSYKDPLFETFYPAILKLLAQGTYHYLKSNVSGITQADHFLNTIRGKQFQMLVMDFEGYGNVLNDAFVMVAYESLVHVQSMKPDVSTILYTSPNLYDTVLYPAAMRIWGRDVFMDFDLWIAQYPWVVNVDGEPVMPKNRKDWKLWQFSDAGSPAEHGTKYAVDRNIFNGGMGAFKEWLHLGGTPPPPNGGSMNGTARENGGRIGKIRTAPSRYATQTGQVAAFTTIEFVSIANSIDSGAYAADKWFLLPDGRYVNYIISGQEYFTILTQPTTEPPPNPDPTPLPATYAATLDVKDAAGTLVASYKGTLSKQ